MNKKPKVLLIGWDAADWKVINPLLDAGMMPNLEKMVNGGTIGNLASMDPAYSPMLWTSIGTGKRAYKHGVLGFIEPTPDGKNIRPVMSISRKVKAIWNILSENEYKTHVLGWWPSHPAEPINGISISNFYQKDVGLLNDPWPMAEGTVHPSDYSERFEKLRVHPEELTGQHILPFVPNGDKIDQKLDPRIYNIAKITAHAASIQAAATNILRTEDWDFTAVYFDAIDHYCHGFMKYHPPLRDHIPKPDFDLYHQVVTSGYRYHDMLLGRLLELAGEEATVMLISDHGFQPDKLRPKYIPNEPAGAAYEHSPYGIICIKGTGIKKDEIIHGAGLLDITPTLLQIFGLAVGEDMDGNVLTTIFDKESKIQYIPSWDGEVEKLDSNLDFQAPKEAHEAMLQQLVDLGYVNPMDKDTKKRVKSVKEDCQFNLARSYMDADLIVEAIGILEPLANKNLNVPRYTYFLASCYQLLGRLEDCRKLITRLRTLTFYKPIALDMMEGALLMGEQDYKGALKIFKETERNLTDKHARVHIKIAQCYMALGHLDRAEKAVKQELDNDFDFALAHQIRGLIYFRKDEYEHCCESMFRAIGLEYRMEMAHYYLGLGLYKMGDYENAMEALETTLILMPENNAARNKLIQIYQTHLDLPEKANYHRQGLVMKLKDEVIIVSGLPRSGTSMMMQMLQAGGLELFIDGKRNADENNPKGYYEHEIVKSIQIQKKWLQDAENKAVKIIAPLVRYLPANRKYKIIFMERDINEILASQNTMLKKLGKKSADVYPLQLANSLLESFNTAVNWAKSQENIDFLIVKYSDVLESQFEYAMQISEFLNNKVQAEKLVSVIDSSLYREKLTISN